VICQQGKPSARGDVEHWRHRRLAEVMGQSTVVIIGGGVAGLTAAHELIERGFTVHIYEAILRQDIGLGP
jgi:heterodisulfide reductase subunit A-like polyferredoxin